MTGGPSQRAALLSAAPRGQPRAAPAGRPAALTCGRHRGGVGHHGDTQEPAESGRSENRNSGESSRMT